MLREVKVQSLNLVKRRKMGTQYEKGAVEEGEELVMERMVVVVMDKLFSTLRQIILKSLILLRLLIPFLTLLRIRITLNRYRLYNLYLLQFPSLPFRISKTPT